MDEEDQRILFEMSIIFFPLSWKIISVCCVDVTLLVGMAHAI